jgi:hypothetical protein
LCRERSLFFSLPISVAFFTSDQKLSSCSKAAISSSLAFISRGFKILSIFSSFLFSFWSDVKKATEIGKEKNKLLSRHNKFIRANEVLTDANELYEMAKEEDDEETIEMLFADAEELEEAIQETEV